MVAHPARDVSASFGADAACQGSNVDIVRCCAAAVAICVDVVWSCDRNDGCLHVTNGVHNMHLSEFGGDEDQRKIELPDDGLFGSTPLIDHWKIRLPSCIDAPSELNTHKRVTWLTTLQRRLNRVII